LGPTVGQQVFVSGLHLGPMTRVLILSDIWGLLIVGPWVPRDSWAYFIVSIFETPPIWRARFLYLFPSGTGQPSYISGLWVCLINLHITAWYFYSSYMYNTYTRPLSTHVQVQVQVILRRTVCLPVRLAVEIPLGPTTRFQFSLFHNYFLSSSCRAPSLTRGRVCNWIPTASSNCET
jgi:hypothetical protein